MTLAPLVSQPWALACLQGRVPRQRAACGSDPRARWVGQGGYSVATWLGTVPKAHLCSLSPRRPPKAGLWGTGAMAPRGRGSPCTPRPRAMAPRPGASLHPAPMPRSVRLTSRVGLSWPRSQHRAAWCGRVQPMAGLSPWTLRHLLHPGWDGSKPDPGGHTAGPERSHAGCSMTTCLRLALQPQPRTSGPAGDSWPETQGGWWGPGLGAGSPSQLVAEGGGGTSGACRKSRVA